MEKEKRAGANARRYQGRQVKITPVTASMFVVMRMDVIVQTW